MKDNIGKISKVKIKLGDGTEYDVACTMGVLIRYQMMTGKNVFRREDMENMSPADYVKFLACAIFKESPELKIAELSEQVSGMAVNQVLEIVSKIFEQGEVKGEASEKKT